MDKYQIEVTERQLYHISNCIELVSRLKSGQLDVLTQISDKIEIEDVKYIKSKMFPELRENQSYGVGHKDLGDRDELYEMYKEILFYLAIKDKWDNVHSYKPLKYTDEPLIKIKGIK